MDRETLYGNTIETLKDERQSYWSNCTSGRKIDRTLADERVRAIAKILSPLLGVDYEECKRLVKFDVHDELTVKLRAAMGLGDE